MKKILPIILLIVSFEVFSQKKIPEKNVDVVLGIDKILNLDFQPSTRLEVGSDGIVSTIIFPSKRQITLKGQKPGQTNVDIRNQNNDIQVRYLVTVKTTSESKIVQELREFIGDVEGIEIVIKGNKVVVEGNIIVPTDIGKVVTVLEKYPDVIRLVELSPQTQVIIAEKMQEELQQQGLKTVTVKIVNGVFWLEGVVNSAPLRDRAAQIANAYVPDRIQSLANNSSAFQGAQRQPVLNFITIEEQSTPPQIPELIRIQAQFVELSKDYNKIFSFNWTPLLGGDGGSIQVGRTTDGNVTTKSNGTFSAIISNLFPRLNSAKQAGYARVVQSGLVITKNNENATLRKQSERRFNVGSGENAQAGTASAGFNLAVTPQILPEEKIDMDLNISVSVNVGQDPPETNSNSVITKIIVKSGDTAVVGGIVNQTTSTAFDQDPTGDRAAEDSSPLFSFLRSKAFQDRKNQFVVFVTPKITKDAAEETDSIKRKFRKRTR